MCIGKWNSIVLQQVFVQSKWSVCVKVSLSVCLGKDSGQQGTGWVQGVRFPKGASCCLARTVCGGGGHWPLLFIIFSFKHTHTHTHRFPQHSSQLSHSFSWWMNGFWSELCVAIGDDGEWMGLWECESWMRSWKSYRSLTSDQGTAVSNESLSVILTQSAEQLWGEEGGTETRVWSVVFFTLFLFGCRFTGAIC